MKKVLESIPNYVRFTRWSQHILFWIFSWIFITFIEYSVTHGEIVNIALKQFTNIIFYAVLVYFNILFLVPHYFQDKRFPAYFILLVVSVIVVTPIYTLVLYLQLGNDNYAKTKFLSLRNGYYFFNFFIMGSSTIYVIIKDWINQKREKSELEKQHIESELNFLKTQINPHFLFNTLNSIYALTLKKSNQAPEVVIKLSEMMRYMLYECNEPFVPLDNEITYLKNYISLEKIRQAEDFNIDFSVTGDSSNKIIAPLIFISFVENSFKHGLAQSMGTGFVSVKFTIEDELLHFRIANNKTERKKTQGIGGIGLENVKKRLDLIYTNIHRIEIFNDERQFIVELSIQLNQNKKLTT